MSTFFNHGPSHVRWSFGLDLSETNATILSTCGNGISTVTPRTVVWTHRPLLDRKNGQVPSGSKHHLRLARIDPTLGDIQRRRLGHRYQRAVAVRPRVPMGRGLSCRTACFGWGREVQDPTEDGFDPVCADDDVCVKVLLRGRGRSERCAGDEFGDGVRGAGGVRDSSFSFRWEVFNRVDADSEVDRNRGREGAVEHLEEPSAVHGGPGVLCVCLRGGQNLSSVSGEKDLPRRTFPPLSRPTTGKTGPSLPSRRPSCIRRRGPSARGFEPCWARGCGAEGVVSCETWLSPDTMLT